MNPATYKVIYKQKEYRVEFCPQGIEVDWVGIMSKEEDSVLFHFYIRGSEDIGKWTKELAENPKLLFQRLFKKWEQAKIEQQQIKANLEKIYNLDE